MAPYPWLQRPWQLLTSAAADRRLHHANLICGTAGVGKLEFAQAFAKALMCEQPPELAPCGQCSRCALTTGDTHPDITVLDWQDKASVISVDQVRRLTEKLTLTASYGAYRVAIINRAHTLTTAAANGLLKTLEEPGPGCVLLLLADREATLPATIRSRCQRVVISTPSWEAALGWLHEQNVVDAEIALEFAQGSPLLAQSQAGSRDFSQMSVVRNMWGEFLLRDANPAELASETAVQLGTRESLTLFMRWTTDLAKKLELSIANGRLSSARSHVERQYLSQTLNLLQSSLRLDNASLKTQAVLEGVLADIRIYRLRIRAENSQ